MTYLCGIGSRKEADDMEIGKILRIVSDSVKMEAEEQVGDMLSHQIGKVNRKYANLLSDEELEKVAGGRPDLNAGKPKQPLQ